MSAIDYNDNIPQKIDRYSVSSEYSHVTSSSADLKTPYPLSRFLGRKYSRYTPVTTCCVTILRLG